jgi:hypothetical protein
MHTLNDDHAHCVKFSHQLLQLLEGQKELIHKILNDEAHFHLLHMNTNRTPAIGQTVTPMNGMRNHYTVQRLQ